MKKLLSLLLAVALATVFTACSGDSSSDTPDAGNNDASTSTKISAGTIDGDVYKNAYLDLEFTKPSNWTYMSDEEIAAAVGMGADLLKEDYAAALESTPALFDMIANDAIDGTNVIIGFENLDATASGDITVEEYIDLLKQQFAAVTTMEVKFEDETAAVALGGNTYTRIIATTDVSGVDMTQAYYMHKDGIYMTTITVTLTGGYTLAEVEAMFN